MSKQRRMKQLWVDGFSVDPIHFQYQDAYHEQLLDRRLESVSPHAWGVLDLDVDQNALRAGVVRLQQFRAVLRGGIWVDISGPDGDLLPERPLDETSARAERVDVFVTLAQLDDRLPNVDVI